MRNFSRKAEMTHLTHLTHFGGELSESIPTTSTNFALPIPEFNPGSTARNNPNPLGGPGIQIAVSQQLSSAKLWPFACLLRAENADAKSVTLVRI